MTTRPGTLAAIGNTPVARLDGLTAPEDATVWVKLESANPTGSYKDRMALAMIEGAERAGRLHPGQTVVEYTGGSTGSSLALVCAVKGYPLHIVTSDAFAPEKLRTMEALGAVLDIVSSPRGITADLVTRLRLRAAEIVAEVDGYATDQFTNTDMIDGYRALGDEIVRQVPGGIDAFVCFVGTAGCYLGSCERLRDHYPQLHRVVVEPAESAVISGGSAGTHRIQGGGVGFVPPLLTEGSFDEVMTVASDEAEAMARQAARRCGVFSGPSTGANLVAALRLAHRLGPDRQVVTVQVDSGLKYLSGGVYGS